MAGNTVLVVIGVAAVLGAAGWWLAVGLRQWRVAVRVRQVARVHDRLQVQIQHKYEAICSHLTGGPEWTPQRQQALVWALQQIEQALVRQRDEDVQEVRRGARTPVPAMVPAVLGTGGAVCLVAAVVLGP